jgi:hypothetical protein
MPTPSWIGKLLENPLVTDLVAGRLPEAVQHTLADVRAMLAEGRFRPEALVEGPLEGDQKVDGVGIFLGMLRDSAELRGVNFFRGQVEGGKLRAANVMLAEVHAGQLNGVNALIGVVHGGELTRANLVAADVHGGTLRQVNVLVGDVHGGDVHCNILIGDVHGGTVRTKRHVGTGHGGEVTVTG